MEIELPSLLILCPLVFLAGFVDAIAGGGGLIALPAYIFAGLPMHNALATNKMSGFIGTVFSSLRFWRGNFIHFKMMAPSIIAALVGSAIGARLVLIVPEGFLEKLLLFVLPVSAYFVLKSKSYEEGREEYSVKTTGTIAFILSFAIGAYDGFYGPGTGTFLMLLFYSLAKMRIQSAAGNAKIINLSSNFAAFAAFLVSGKVFLVTGLVAALFSIAGHWLGAGLAIKGGLKIIRPVVLVVLLLLFVKILWPSIVN